MIVWWLAFSRLPWVSRRVGRRLPGAVFWRGYLLAHSTVNWMGLLMYALPIALTAAVLWLLFTRGAKTLAGWAGLAAIAAATFGYFDLLRIDGITGDLVAERSWRWTKTAEDRFLDEQKRRAADTPHGDPPPSAERARRLRQRLDASSAGPAATAIYATSASAATGRTPTGRSSRRANCGGGWSVPAGRRSP